MFYLSIIKLLAPILTVAVGEATVAPVTATRSFLVLTVAIGEATVASVRATRSILA